VEALEAVMVVDAVVTVEAVEAVMVVDAVVTVEAVEAVMVVEAVELVVLAFVICAVLRAQDNKYLIFSNHFILYRSYYDDESHGRCKLMFSGKKYFFLYE
jgi:hypothetical protein